MMEKKVIVQVKEGISPPREVVTNVQETRESDTRDVLENKRKKREEDKEN